VTEFVEVGSGAGTLFLPAGLVRPVPFTAEAWDRRLLTPSAVDFAALNADGAVEAVGAVRRLRARADAAEARLTGHLSRLRGQDRSLAKEVSLEARVSEKAAANRVA
jgi:hypothetical protein